MISKGGIRPRKKFGVQANKAERLLTDYIVEQLSPNGCAVVVVPNGIVTTSLTAYKQLRQYQIA
jgi:type I restriction-modification system DNA methylase subunit